VQHGVIETTFRVAQGGRSLVIRHFRMPPTERFRSCFLGVFATPRKFFVAHNTA
jgi:hypothetical protein